ncbi:hypothetical protein [Shewanella sp. ENK2]|uniref:hypothetical protein n=1 Tax=Shewanella sp. ENK2 TaxID=2775245 RepID=UPI00374A6DC6
MSKFFTFLKVIFTLLFIAAITYGFYVGLKEVWDVFKAVDPKLGAGMIAASATVIVSVVTVVFSKRQEHKIDIQNQLREKRFQFTRGLLSLFFLLHFQKSLVKSSLLKKK